MIQQDPSLLKHVAQSSAYDLAEDEEVKLFLHKHWIIEFRYYFLFFLSFMFLPLVIFFWEQISYMYRIPLLLFVVFVIHFSVIRVFLAWLDYYLDVMIITNKRVIEIDQSGMFHRKTNDISLLKIQNISGERNGIMGEWLNYGSVDIKTSGEMQDLGLKYVPEPLEVAAEIRKQQDIHMSESFSRSSQIEQLS